MLYQSIYNVQLKKFCNNGKEPERKVRFEEKETAEDVNKAPQPEVK